MRTVYTKRFTDEKTLHVSYLIRYEYKENIDFSIFRRNISKLKSHVKYFILIPINHNCTFYSPQSILLLLMYVLPSYLN